MVSGVKSIIVEGMAEQSSSRHGGQDAERERKRPGIRHPQTLVHRGLLPPAMPHPLKFLEPPHISPLGGDQPPQK
jgi:hypothetical protein